MNPASLFPARPLEARHGIRPLAARFGRARLQTKLILSHAAVAAIVVILGLHASQYVHGQAVDHLARGAAVTAAVQELYALEASASEEGFSYVLSGDPNERAQFASKLDVAARRCDSIEAATLTDDERRGLLEVVANVRLLREAGDAMFDSFEESHVFAHDRYVAYEAAIDRSWESIASLDSVARAERARRWASARQTSDRLSVAIGLVAIALAVGLGSALGRRLGRPLTALHDAAVAFGQGRDHPTVRTDDEIGDVVGAFETMKRSVRENQKALVMTEQMAVIGRLTAGLAHELNSPLAAVILTADEMSELARRYQKAIGDPAVQPAQHQELAAGMLECGEIAGEAAKRAAEFVRSIRSQARAPREGKSERFDVATVARDSINLVRHAARAAKCEVSLVTDTQDVQLVGAPCAMAHALTNLLQNGVDAMGDTGGGRLTLRIEGDARELRIHVADTGPGIPPDVLPRIFEPLYTTKSYGKGTGLGLPVVKEAIEQRFGGRIQVETQVGRGTTFTLSIPRRPAQ
jgi:signal transduction histidine kinase